MLTCLRLRVQAVRLECLVAAQRLSITVVRTVCAQILGGLSSQRQVTRPQQHQMARLAQLARYFAADALVCAGDQCDGGGRNYHPILYGSCVRCVVTETKNTNVYAKARR